MDTEVTVREKRQKISGKRWDIVKQGKISPDSVDYLFKDIFVDKKIGFRELTYGGWKPIDDIYHHPTDYAHGWFTENTMVSDGNETSATDEDNVKIAETDKGITIKITLPNIVKDSIYLEVSGQILILSCRQINVNRASEGIPRFVDEKTRNIQRFVLLPKDTGPDHIRARLVGNTININILKQA
ncbi:MAG: hypothetical protein HKM93_05710 [Desulfobacteraceae bacterium]|nr:hypothetical protein [Desulfobacteraceae bacterium]